MSIYVIAELGCNHLGSTDKAKQLIELAAKADCNAVKIQLYKTELINDVKLHGYLRQCELTDGQIFEIEEIANDNGLDLICSVFDAPSVLRARDLSIETVKVPSGQIHSPSVLNEVFKINWKVIISTGMCEYSAMRTAYTKALCNGFDTTNLSFLHCVSGYPVPENEANLLVINTLQTLFNVKIGYSDHCLNLITGGCAAILGAEIIEHHIKLNGQHDTPDATVSFDESQLYEYVKHIRAAERLRGNGSKLVSACEQQTLFRRDYR